jgi:phytoene dehydrogenase-like protein
LRDDLSTIFMREETTTIDALRHRWKFSDRMIDRFFRPFFGGIFFDTALQASSRMFEFVFKMFSEGQTVLPATGMEALPRQLAADLPASGLRLNTTVTAINGQQVTLDDGSALEAPAVVVATEAPAAQQLIQDIQPTAARSTTCLYYAATNSPLDAPLLVLNGDGDGPINNLCVPSDVAPSYAPEGRALISVVVVGNPDETDDALEAQVRGQLIDWFGSSAELWDHLRTYRIPYALPEQRPPFLSPPERPVRRRAGLYVCGDHRRTASLNGALGSGQAAARAVLTDLPTLTPA